MCIQIENDISSDFILIWSATDFHILQAVTQLSKLKIHIFFFFTHAIENMSDASQVGVWSTKQATAY